MAEANRLRRAGKTHTGHERAENQDNLIEFSSLFGEVFVVADGMGGARGGAAAARMVVDGFQRQLTTLPDSMPVADALRQAARLVAEEVHAVGHGGDPQYAGMGSTVVLALVSGRRLVVAHIGDSRAYLYRAEKLQRLTRDHTAVQRMVDSGMISEDEARDHPNASVLSRAIGPHPAVEIEVSEPIELRPGDGVLMCSDGLSGYVDDPVIERALAPFFSNPEEAATALIQLALDAGGEDNVTVQYLHLQAHRPTLRERVVAPAPTVMSGSGGRPLLRNPVLFVTVVLLTALAAFGLGWAFRDRIGLGGQPAEPGSPTTAPSEPGSPQVQAPGGQVSGPPETARPAQGEASANETAPGSPAVVPERPGGAGGDETQGPAFPKEAEKKASQKAVPENDEVQDEAGSEKAIPDANSSNSAPEKDGPNTGDEPPSPAKTASGKSDENISAPANPPAEP